MTLMIGLHHFFFKCQKNVGQDSVSGIVRQCEVTSRKYDLKQGNRIDVRFIKYDIQGCIFKMCRNFIYEVVEHRRDLKKL
jgi:hypothetical protein